MSVRTLQRSGAGGHRIREHARESDKECQFWRRFANWASQVQLSILLPRLVGRGLRATSNQHNLNYQQGPLSPVVACEHPS